jgi:hypothetical protein
MHFGVGRNAQEVGVLRTVGHGVEGHVLGERADGLAADGQFDDRVEEVTGAKGAGQFLFLEVDGNRFLVAAINHGGVRPSRRRAREAPLPARSRSSADRVSVSLM